jgi:uncharacterized membrane protein (UPF0127 family)
MDRRRFLSVAGVALLGGCRAVSDTETDTPAPGTATPGRDVRADSTPVTSGTPTRTPGTSSPTGTPVHPGYETTDVVVRTPAGERLGVVTAAVADTSLLRYRGLSDTASLPADRGMLFVFETVGNRTFVMRRMDFGIDIVYADAGGTITRIHHAPAPGTDGGDDRYPGRGRYVLEVNRGWTTDRGVTAGDVLAFDL